ncbi:MAG: dihydrofolate reductase [Firmicutes bacterium]|nr:dihydrofolate reductase [Bacillota bacterium]
MIAIVAVDNEFGIGCENDLLYSIPEDMQFFKEKTMNKVVVMGYATLISLPNSKPLKNRTNIVLVKEQDVKIEGATVVHSIEELLEETEKYSKDDVFVMGGGQVYAQLLPFCHKAFITKIKGMKKADTFFPNIDQMSNWKIATASEEKQHEEFTFTFNTYVNDCVKT